MIGLQPGELFGGRYQVIRSIGAGGMGAVYLAADPRHEGFFVALKVLYPGIIKTPETRERFRNELLAAYRVNHPNVVRAYEYFDEGELQAFAMEYVDGGDLLEKMKKGPLKTELVISILKQAAAGLLAVHSQGILHRDLKPENILLTKKGEVKLTDFGVARLSGRHTLTQIGAMVGTPKYLAPEYVETSECDHRADIYALGVIGYEMLSGMSPFKSNSRVSLMVERLKTKVVPLRLLVADGNPDLMRVVEKAMSISVARRYQSTADLIQDLECIERGEPPVHIKEDTPEDISAIGALSEVFRGWNGTTRQPSTLASAINLTFQTGLWKIFTKHRRSGVLATLLLFMVCILAGVWSFNGSRPPFAGIPKGVYSGVANGVLSDRVNYPIMLWRTDAGDFALLGLNNCGVAKVNPAGRFDCGDLSFEMKTDGLAPNQAVGTIRELSWGKVGTWSLSGY